MKSKKKLTISIAGLLIFICAICAIKPIRPVGISLFGFVFYYIFLYLLLRKTTTWHLLVNEIKNHWASVLVLSTAAIVFAGIYLSHYNFIPIWDQITYWSQTLELNESFHSSIRHSLRMIISSVNHSDYNLLQSWIASLPVMLFPSWKATQFVEFILTFLPSSLLISGFVTRHVQILTKHQNGPIFPAIYFCSLCVPVASRPIFTGYLDGYASLLFITLLILVFDHALITSPLLAFFTGLAIAGTFLLRRWFIFSIIGLSLSVALYWGIVLLRTASEKRVTLFKQLLATIGSIAVGALLPLVTIFRGFVVRSFAGNYSASYASWTQYHSISEKLVHYSFDYGLFWFILYFVSVLVLLISWTFNRVHRENKFSVEATESISLWLLLHISLVVTLTAFWHVQDFSAQHWYTVAPTIFTIVMIVLFTALSKISHSIANLSAIIIVCIFALLSLLSGFSILGTQTSWNTLFATPIQRPYQQNDVKAKHALISYLTKKTDGRKTVYFAAASGNINSSLARAVNLPEKLSANFPVASSDVDSRDGFNTAFFDSSFVVTSNPTSYHMAPENEKVVGTLNELVRDRNSYIGKHFSQLKSFTFDEGYQVTVFERKEKETRKDITRLQATFAKYYPDQPDLFSNRFEQYISQNQLK